MDKTIIPKENIVIDSIGNKIIITSSQEINLNVLSSALISFTYSNYILFDKDDLDNTILHIIPKAALHNDSIQDLINNILSQINVYNIHKQKLQQHKPFVDFVMDLVIKTNNPKTIKNE